MAEAKREARGAGVFEEVYGDAVPLPPAGERDLFALQARIAVQKGELSPAPIEEAILMFTQYVGYPRASGLRSATRSKPA